VLLIILSTLIMSMCTVWNWSRISRRPSVPTTQWRTGFENSVINWQE